MARKPKTPYHLRYPKIVRAKRIVSPIAIGMVIISFIAAYNKAGLYWWPVFMVSVIVLLWSSSPTAKPVKHDEEQHNLKR